jgi:hypothetical protein
MGLLEALDLHRDLESGTRKDSAEVEYRLFSWGEIYLPFLGDREHSTVARWILTDFPFKLFSSSNPYDPLPQKLCLTFKAPYETKLDKERIRLSGIFSHEIAKEFAAFLSLVTRRRVFVGRQLRYNGLPIEEEVDQYDRSHFQERQRLREIDPKSIEQLLRNLQSMPRDLAGGYVLALRLYHLAVEMMYTEPEFSYLLLVTCLETVSSAVFKDYKPENEEQFLNSRFRGWDKISNALPSELKQDLRNLLLRDERYTFRKLLKFVTENVPKHFSDNKNDAKPDYYVGLVGSRSSLREFAQEHGIDYVVEADLDDKTGGQKYLVRSPTTITEMERVDRNHLEQALRSIYNARSGLIHEGTRLPRSIVFGLHRGLPTEAVVEMQEREGSKSHMKIPPLLTLERLVSVSMMEFLRKQAGAHGPVSSKITRRLGDAPESL